MCPPLPKEAVIAGHPCRLWHASQRNFCKRCALQGHRTTALDNCEAYDPDPHVTVFWSDNNPLSNYYSCTLVNGDYTFDSVKHFYQFEFCTNCDRPDLAHKVIENLNLLVTLSLHLTLSYRIVQITRLHL